MKKDSKPANDDTEIRLRNAARAVGFLASLRGEKLELYRRVRRVILFAVANIAGECEASTAVIATAVASELYNVGVKLAKEEGEAKKGE